MNHTLLPDVLLSSQTFHPDGLVLLVGVPIVRLGTTQLQLYRNDQ